MLQAVQSCYETLGVPAYFFEKIEQLLLPAGPLFLYPEIFIQTSYSLNSTGYYYIKNQFDVKVYNKISKLFYDAKQNTMFGQW